MSQCQIDTDFQKYKWELKFVSKFGKNHTEYVNYEINLAVRQKIE